MDRLDILEKMLDSAIKKGDLRLVDSITNEMIEYCSTKRGK